MSLRSEDQRSLQWFPVRVVFLFALMLSGSVPTAATCAEDDGSCVIRAKHVHTMDGKTLSPGMVLVRDGKIRQVSEEITLDPMPRIIEVGHLMPGLVNARSTAGLVGSGGEASREVTPEFETAGMIDLDSRDFLEAIDGGETTLHIMPSTENVIAGWTCLMKNSPTLSFDSLLEARKGVALTMCSDPAGRNR